MSSDVVIRVENLSKRYTLKHQSGQKSGDGIRHAIQDAVSTPLRAIRSKFRNPEKLKPETISASQNLSISASSEDFWALRDVSFEVKRGEVLGIIGRNGAGKSTLLKILSRITEPTSGRIGIKGRIASLLEVGTGFHPELTGRENIFLNGAILGMSRAEVRRKFDEIVDFAGVEKFLDTPVKRYSSGMYVRLAFAVAAHLEPEILIIDEVLAVGDSEFQSKCLGKMKDAACSGRTVIFVSHNMDAAKQLCTNGLWMLNGQTKLEGAISDVIDHYLISRSSLLQTLDSAARRPGSGECRISQVKASRSALEAGEDITIDISIGCQSRHERMYFSAHLVNQNDSIIAQCDSRLYGVYCSDTEARSVQLTISVPHLKAGTYYITLYLYAPHLVDQFDNATSIEILPSSFYPCAVPPDGIGKGIILAPFSWKLSASNNL